MVLVTSRAPEDRLARELAARADDWKGRGDRDGHHHRRRALHRRPSLTQSMPAAATRRSWDDPAVEGDDVPFKREIAELLPLE